MCSFRTAVCEQAQMHEFSHEIMQNCGDIHELTTCAYPCWRAMVMYSDRVGCCWETVSRLRHLCSQMSQNQPYCFEQPSSQKQRQRLHLGVAALGLRVSAGVCEGLVQGRALLIGVLKVDGRGSDVDEGRGR